MEKIYKAVCFSILAMALAASHSGCKKTDGYNTIASTDKTKPGVITNIKVTNFNGGAYITYTLPNSQNILYVQATYPINDKRTRQTKSSYYSDSITVGGFAKSQDYKVTLYVVSRADVKSDSVVVTVHPDTPPYLLMLPTVKMAADFGGVNITAIDSLKANVGVIAISPSVFHGPTGTKSVLGASESQAGRMNSSPRPMPKARRRLQRRWRAASAKAS